MNNDNITDFTFTQSAFKHDISVEDILKVIINPIYSKQHPDQPVALLVGFDSNGRTIEVAYDTQTRTVFHAMLTSGSKKRKKDGLR